MSASSDHVKFGGGVPKSGTYVLWIGTCPSNRFAALRAAGANAGQVELDEFYAVNITSSPTSSAPIITIRFELTGPPSELKNSASEVNILLKAVCCRLRLADG